AVHPRCTMATLGSGWQDRWPIDGAQLLTASAQLRGPLLAPTVGVHDVAPVNGPATDPVPFRRRRPRGWGQGCPIAGHSTPRHCAILTWRLNPHGWIPLPGDA